MAPWLLQFPGIYNVQCVICFLRLSFLALEDYWSTGLGRPPADGQQDFNRTSATEIDGKTVVEFYRKAKTGDDKDVQFEVRFSKER